MSQYPINDSTGVYNAVNYLVSSPQSIGQDFNGISEYLPAYLTGNYRLPFTSTTPVTLNVPAINCTAVYQLADNIFRFEFTGAQPVPPFNIGATAIVTTGWANSFYNDYWSPAHIIESTTTSATIQTDHLYPGTGDDLLGGTIALNTMSPDPVYGRNRPMSTVLNSKVTITSGTDRAFISAQLDQIINYSLTTTSELSVVVNVNRYKGFPNISPKDPGYYFEPWPSATTNTILSKSYSFTGLTSSGSQSIETIFTTAIDNPGPGYWWYILELTYSAPSGDLIVDTMETDLRSFVLQVIKQ